MKLNKRIPDADEKEGILRSLRWCKLHHLAFAGLPYSDELVNSNGIHLELIVPEGTGTEQLEQALREGYRERDVVRHSVVVCPTQWFIESRDD